MSNSDLILPSNAKLQTKDKSKAVGLNSPWQRTSKTINGAAEKRGDWKIYYMMYSKHPIVAAAINKIVKTSVSIGFDFVPWDTRSEPDEEEIKKLKEFFNSQPDLRQELYSIYMDILIYGDAYLYVVPDRLRKPRILKRVAPNTMYIKTKTNGEVLEYYQKLEVNDYRDDAEYVTYAPHEILHFKLPDPDNDIYGLSPLEALIWSVTTDIYAMKFNAAFFKNSGVTGTIIAVRNANPDELERNRKWFTENYTGPENAHSPVIVEGEEVSIGKSVATHTEMAFLQGREFIQKEILAVLDVPPSKIGHLESANRSNSKEQDKTFRTESVQPIQALVESVINNRFVRDILGLKNTRFIHADSDGRDQIEQMKYFIDGIKGGVFTFNEVRGKLGYAEVEGGGISGIMTPTGFVPLDRLNLYFQMPQQNVDKVPEVPEDPSKGEPTPPDKVRTNVPLVEKDLFGLQEGLIGLMQEKPSRLQITKSLADLTDATVGIDDDDDLIVRTRNSIRKSLGETDELLQEAYLEQARDYARKIVAVVQQNYRKQ